MIKDGNKRVQITMPKEKYKEFKKLAIDAEMNLSDFLVNAGTAVATQIIKDKEIR